MAWRSAQVCQLFHLCTRWNTIQYWTCTTCIYWYEKPCKNWVDYRKRFFTMYQTHHSCTLACRHVRFIGQIIHSEHVHSITHLWHLTCCVPVSRVWVQTARMSSIALHAYTATNELAAQWVLVLKLYTLYSAEHTRTKRTQEMPRLWNYVNSVCYLIRQLIASLESGNQTGNKIWKWNLEINYATPSVPCGMMASHESPP